MSDITRDYSFGGWLKSFRIKRELTLRKASEIIGMDSGNYSKLERSILNPPNCASKIVKMSNALGFDESETEMLMSTAFTHHLALFKHDWNKP